MDKEQKIVILEKPETANFIVYGQGTSSQYITYRSDNSLVPSSLDQIIKNKVLVSFPESKDFLQNESRGKPY